MIAPTARGCKRAMMRAIKFARRRSSGQYAVTASLAEIIIPPNFRPSTALLGCDTRILRWPGPFGSGFLSPQPPGVVGIGPVRSKVTPHWANASWSFFFLGVGGFENRRRATPLALENNSGIYGSTEFSGAKCRRHRASGLAVRGCRPGRKPPRHRRHRGRYFPAAPSNFRNYRSSRRP
jgi:hypothetical protein